MSKRKRDISYIKPNEPAFITRMKEQSGYKEGPTVKTKFQQDSNSDSEVEDHDDEKPTIVVLKSGDLTAEEAAIAQAKLDEAPADLNERIIFSKRAKTKPEPDAKGPSSETDVPNKPSKLNSQAKQLREGRNEKGEEKNKKVGNRNLLSFTEEDGEEV